MNPRQPKIRACVRLHGQRLETGNRLVKAGHDGKMMSVAVNAQVGRQRFTRQQYPGSVLPIAAMGNIEQYAIARNTEKRQWRHVDD